MILAGLICIVLYLYTILLGQGFLLFGLCSAYSIVASFRIVSKMIIDCIHKYLLLHNIDNNIMEQFCNLFVHIDIDMARKVRILTVGELVIVRQYLEVCNHPSHEWLDSLPPTKIKFFNANDPMLLDNIVKLASWRR